MAPPAATDFRHVASMVCPCGKAHTAAEVMELRLARLETLVETLTDAARAHPFGRAMLRKLGLS